MDTGKLATSLERLLTPAKGEFEAGNIKHVYLKLTFSSLEVDLEGGNLTFTGRTLSKDQVFRKKTPLMSEDVSFWVSNICQEVTKLLAKDEGDRPHALDIYVYPSEIKYFPRSSYCSVKPKGKTFRL